MSIPISLVITVYNRERYLAAAIESVLNQTRTELELLIWDDGSTDGSLAIAHDYAKQDKRVRVVATPHTGRGQALHDALANTTGRYLGWVDSDDLLSPTALEITAALLDSQASVGMIYTDYLVMDETGQIKGLGKRCQIPYSSERLLVEFMTFHFRLIRRNDINLFKRFIGDKLPLAAGASYTITESITLPSTGIGSKYLLFKTDASNHHSEVDETNNVLAVPIQIRIPPLVGSLSALNGTVTGILNLGEANNPSRHGKFSDDYQLNDLIVGDLVTLNLTSPDFDTYLQLIDAETQQVITADDDSGEGVNSRLSFLVADGINYTVRATSFISQVSGNYTLTSTTAPDFVVTDSVTPSFAVLSETIEVSWTVTNQHSGTASADWYDHIYLSSDASLDGTDTLLSRMGADDRTPLADGASYTFSRPLTLPSSTTLGSHYLIFVADGNNSQIEADETNNIRAVPIVLKAPNLVVERANTPRTASLSSPIRVSWMVTNQGEVTARANWYDLVYLSNDEKIDSTDWFWSFSVGANTPLNPGKSYTIESYMFLPNTTIGNKYLLFVVDGRNEQGETNETDNIYAVPIQLNAPNLVLTGATAPATINLGQSVEVSWTVTNQGEGSGVSYWNDYVYISDDDKLDGTDTYLTKYTKTFGGGADIRPGESQTIRRNITVPNTKTGNQYLLFVTDRDNTQAETNETDNVFALPITINNQGSDLVVTEATAPTSAILGDSVELSWTVSNIGSATASADWYDYIYVSSSPTFDGWHTYLTRESISTQTPLAAGGNYRLSRQITLPNVAPGSLYLLFVADGDRREGEIDETNNIRAVPITLTAPPVVGTISAANGMVTGTLSPSDRNNPARIGSFSDDYTLSDLMAGEPVVLDLSASFNIPSLQLIDAETQRVIGERFSGGAYYSQLTFTPIAGTNYLVRTTSYRNGETGSYTLRAASGFPDLAISASTVSLSASVGSTVEVAWTVSNLGRFPASANWYDYIYLSSDPTLDSSDIYLTRDSIQAQTPLTAGGSYSLTRHITLPDNLNQGNHYLLFVADRENSQAETEETNNLFALPIELKAPNLVVSGAVVPQEAILSGTIEASWTVTNSGEGIAQAHWLDRVYLSDDPTLDETDVRLDYQWTGSYPSLNALDPGASYTVTANVTLPRTGTGSRYLLLATDASQRQGETNETDNVRAVSIELKAPDLVISAVTAPVSAVWGQRIRVAWTVTNQGESAAPGYWVDDVFISDDTVFDDTDEYAFETEGGEGLFSNLAAGSSYTKERSFTIPSNWKPGVHYLLFVTDNPRYNYLEDYGQGETDETNNLVGLPIAIGFPELVVESLEIPSTAKFGESVNLSWTVRNMGIGSTGVGWSDRLWLSRDNIFSDDDKLLLTQTAPRGLLVNDAYTQTASITLPLDAELFDGNYFILVQADALGQQPESNESNNSRVSELMTLTLPPLPDLVVSQIITPVEGLSGQPIEVTWRVKNQGNGAATGTWTDKIYLSNDPMVGDDQLFGSFSYTGTLAANSEVVRRQLITLPKDWSGQHWVIVQTDADNQLFEHAHENNNTAVGGQPIETRLSPVPNLQVSGVTAPSTAFSSQETVITWTVTNTGTGSTSTPVWHDRVWLSLDQNLDDTDIYLGQTTNSSYLKAGDSYSNSLTVTLPQGIDGYYYFLVQTDYTNQVFELDSEDDNLGVSRATDVELTPPPDLQVTAVNAPSQSFSGQPISLSWTVTNAGTGRTLETNWYDDIYMSADEIWDGNDYYLGRESHSGVLYSGESYSVTRNFTLPIGVSGDFYFLVRTDRGNQVYEHVFESNNTGRDATPTTIYLTPPPDLEVELVDVPTKAIASHEFTVNYHVTNTGSTVTPNVSWLDSFYLSTDDQLNTSTDLLLGSHTRYGALNTEASYTQSASFTLPNGINGNYYVFVVSDSRNEVFELDNDNNLSFDAQALTISSRPADLVVSDASIPETAEAGKAILVEWTVSNTGIGDTAIARWTDRVFASSNEVIGDADDILLASVSRDGLLDVGGTYSRSELVPIPFNLSGDYNLFVVTDADNQVYEAERENNNRSLLLPVTVTRQTPDLQVSQVSVPESASSGQSLTVNWTVKNWGAGKTNVDYWYDEVFVSTDTDLGDSNDISLGRVYHSGILKPSTSYSASGTFNLPIDVKGQYYVIVCTDSPDTQGKDRVLETPLENNNDGVTASTTAISLSSVPDLVVASVDAPIEGISGQSFDLTWTVRNNGANTGNSSWRDVFYLSRDQIFDRSTDTYLGFVEHTGSLAASQSYTETTSLSIPRGLSGRFYVFALTDSSDSIYERDGESNNVAYDGYSMQVVLPPPADLMVGSISMPTNGVPGQNATIEYTVTNQGTESALGSWYDSLYLSADEQWDVNDPLLAQVQVSGAVNSGDSYHRTVPTLLPGVTSGDYHVIVRSDIRNVIPESNEGNNIKNFTGTDCD